jgi:hypothetical protein
MNTDHVAAQARDALAQWMPGYTEPDQFDRQYRVTQLTGPPGVVRLRFKPTDRAGPAQVFDLSVTVEERKAIPS